MWARNFLAAQEGYECCSHWDEPKNEKLHRYAQMGNRLFSLPRIYPAELTRNCGASPLVDCHSDFNFDRGRLFKANTTIIVLRTMDHAPVNASNASKYPYRDRQQR